MTTSFIAPVPLASYKPILRTCHITYNSIMPPSENSQLTLYDVTLPGTHDSAAYATRPDLVSRATILPLQWRLIRRAAAAVQSDFAITQTLSVLDQLRAGARFLDLRVSKRPLNAHDPSFWTVHGMVLCVPLADILDQINRFHDEMSANGGCTIVSVFRANLLDAGEEEELARYVHQNLKHDIFDGTRDELRDVPVNQLPPNVVAGLKGDRLNVAWGQDAWLDTYSADKKISFLRRTMLGTKSRALRNNLFVMGWTVTPSVLDIVWRVFSFGFVSRSVVSEAEKMNERFPEFLHLYLDRMRQKVNVVFFDCFSRKWGDMVSSLRDERGGSTDDSSSLTS